MATIRERKSKCGIASFRVQIRKKGFPNISKEFPTREEAEVFAANTEASIENSKGEINIPQLPLKIWLHRYRQEVMPTRAYRAKDEKYLEFWEEQLGTQIAVSIPSERIEFCANELYKKISRRRGQISYETRRKYLLMLSSIYTYAIKHWKWAYYNPLTGCDMRAKTGMKKEIIGEDSEFLKFKENMFLRIKKAMEENNISQRELARRCSMALQTVQYVVDIKNNPTMKNVLKVFKVLGIEMEIK